MTANQFYKYSSACFKHKITIYPKPINNYGMVKIVINKNGIEEVGDKIYREKTQLITEYVKLENGKKAKKVIEVIPPVFEKIGELYKMIAIKNKYVDPE